MPVLFLKLLFFGVVFVQQLQSYAPVLFSVHFTFAPVFVAIW